MSDAALRHRLDPAAAQEAEEEALEIYTQAPQGNEAELTRLRIINTLEIYPKVSPSMLQAAIGPHNKPQFWRPILEKLISDGIAVREQKSHLSERGRYRILIIISLSEDYLAAKAELERMDRQEAEGGGVDDIIPPDRSVRINPLTD